MFVRGIVDDMGRIKQTARPGPSRAQQLPSHQTRPPSKVPRYADAAGKSCRAMQLRAQLQPAKYRCHGPLWRLSGGQPWTVSRPWDKIGPKGFKKDQWARWPWGEAKVRCCKNAPL